MSETTNTTNAISTAAQQGVQKAKSPTIKSYIEMYKGEFAKALPSVITPERFTRIAMTAITQNPKLAECEPQSFVGALLTSAQLGLEPNTPLGQAYLIPYGKQCQFQIGYKGMIELANRSGEIKNIEAHIVRENDEFDFEYGLAPKLMHKPAKANRGAPVWVYAIFHLANGGYTFEVMGYEECLEHGKRHSKTYNNGPWKTDPEQMAKKTVIKRVLKYAPLKSEFLRDISEDEKVSHVDFDSTTGEMEVVIDENGEVVEA